MRIGLWLTAAAVLASLAFAVPCAGMGGLRMAAPPAALPDDYAAALRLIGRQQFADAIPYLDRALAAKPKDADVLNELGYTHRMVGDYPGSLDFYRRALAIDPDHRGAHEYLGELYLNMRDLTSAQGQLAELARVCPEGCVEKDTLTRSIEAYQQRLAAPPGSNPPPTDNGGY